MPLFRPATLAALALASGVLVMSSGCMTAYKQSVGADTEVAFHRIFLTDFDTAWQATLDALKSNALDTSNREAGRIQTRWKDNTALKNLSETYGTTPTYIKAQYRLIVNVAKGNYGGKPSIKVTVQKEQTVTRDALENPKHAPTDGIEENTLLYRIGRLISIRLKIAEQQEEKTRKAVEGGF